MRKVVAATALVIMSTFAIGGQASADDPTDPLDPAICTTDTGTTLPNGQPLYTIDPDCVMMQRHIRAQDDVIAGLQEQAQAQQQRIAALNATISTQHATIERQARRIDRMEKRLRRLHHR